MLSRSDVFCLCEDEYPHPHVVLSCQGARFKRTPCCFTGAGWRLSYGCALASCDFCLCEDGILLILFIRPSGWSHGSGSGPTRGRKLSLFLDEVYSRGDWKYRCGVQLCSESHLPKPFIACGIHPLRELEQAGDPRMQCSHPNTSPLPFSMYDISF